MIAPRHRSLTVEYRQRRKRLLILVPAVVAALVLGLGFYLGQRAAYSGPGMDPESYRVMQLELSVARQRSQALAGDLDVQGTRHEVDRRALEMVRRELAAQKERIAGLEEELRFYQSLMAPGDIAQGLSLRAIELVARQEPGRYAFRIVVQQEARKHELLKGTLYVEVFGLLGEEQAIYPLSELSADLEEAEVALRFRYFQSIEGELVLPQGFDPKGVSVVATVSTPRKAEAREQFPWQLQERFTHAGK